LRAENWRLAAENPEMPEAAKADPDSDCDCDCDSDPD